jgi:hypothetical protein
MAKVVLGSSTLKYLTPSVNALIERPNLSFYLNVFDSDLVVETSLSTLM